MSSGGILLMDMQLNYNTIGKTPLNEHLKYRGWTNTTKIFLSQIHR